MTGSARPPSREIEVSVRDRKIGAKLTSSFLAAAVLCALVGVLARFRS
jgi:hypothetical protein